MSDDELLHRHRAGDAGALQALFARHYASIHRFFELHATWAAEDLTQRTFLGCVERLSKIDGARFRPYLFGIARNQLRMYLRGYNARDLSDRVNRMLPVTKTGLSTLVARSRQQRRMLIALGRMDEELRIVVTLHYWEGFSSAEIGEVLGVAASTARGRLARARADLRKQLDGPDAASIDLDATLSSLIADPE